MQLNKNKKVGKNSGPLLVSCLFFLLPLDRNRSGKFHFIVWHLKSFAWHGVTIKLDCYLNFDLAGFLVRFGSVWFGSLTGWMLVLARIHVAHFRLNHLLSTQIRV